MNFVQISGTGVKKANTYQRTKNKIKASAQLNESVDKLSRKIEKSLPDKGSGFEEIEESYQTKHGKVTLKVKPSTDAETPDYRILKVEFTTPANNKFTPIFEYGTKRDLQRKLSDTAFRDRVETSLGIAILALKRNSRM